MKQIARTAGSGGWKIPTEDEVEVAEILLRLPKLWLKSELIDGYSFNWGQKKKRSVLDLKSESSPETQPPAASEADKSPSTPLDFFTGGSGSDGGCSRKPPSSAKKTLNRKATDDLMEVYNQMHQERELLMKKVKAMKILHQELTSQNLDLKARGQKINYSSIKSVDQQHCHQQISMFAPATPQQQQHCHQQLVVDSNNGKLVCSSNGKGGGRFGLLNQIDPHVKINGEIFDFMASSQPLDQSKYWVMDDDLRVRAARAAAARKKRILRMKEKGMKGMMDNDIRIRVAAAAAARKERMLRMKEKGMKGVMDNDIRIRVASAAARKERMLRMKESKAMKLSKVCR